ncbi:MAG: acyl-CoA dehydrogenase family protein [Dehalococcoidia bacterium]|nr:acyl-CoA dehydrogenase family protein [Dehalococcoidia bacterium]
MDFELSEDQKMLRKTARDFLANECTKTFVREMERDEKGYSPELWRKMVDLGWMGLPFPEQYGGWGGSFLDLAVLAEEMGRACLPGPFMASVVLGGLTILEAGSDAQKEQYLTAIAGGDIFTLALTEPDGSYDAASIHTKATAHGDDFVISGTKFYVPDAHVASHMVVAARTKDGAKQDGISLFIVDARSRGIQCTQLKTIASDKQCEVIFDNVRVPKASMVGKLNQGWPIIQRTLQLAAVAKCAEMVGAAQQVLEMTTAYAKERVQFDKRIGSFQAIQHHCANMLIDLDGMRMLTYEAAWLLSAGLPAQKEVAMAKAWVSDAIVRVTKLGHQVHGGVGYTIDHDLQLYYRRGRAAAALFGNANYQREMIASQLGL